MASPASLDDHIARTSREAARSSNSQRAPSRPAVGAPLGGEGGRPRGAGIRALLALVALAWGALACSGPPQVWGRKIEVAQVEREARARLHEPGLRATAHLSLTWLCLLHGRGCQELAAHGRAAVVGAPDMALAQLSRALALQVRADIGRRASAWMDLLVWSEAWGAGPEELAERGMLSTLASEALARLAVRDRGAVVAVLSRHEGLMRRVLGRGGAARRWRRLLALGPLLTAAAAPRRGGGPGLRGSWLPSPLSRRLYSGLGRLRRVPGGDGWLPLPPSPADQALPAGLRGGRHLLPAPMAGVYAVRFTWGASGGGARTVLWRTRRPVRLWLDGREITPTSGATGDGPGHVTIDAIQRGERRLVVAISLPAGGAPLAVAVLPGRVLPVTPPRDWPAPVRAAVLALDRPDGAVSEGLTRAYPRGPLAVMIALDRAASLELERRASAEVLDRVLDLLPRHFDARVDRAGRARDDGNLALARRLLPSPPGGDEAEARAALRRADLWLERAWQRQSDGLGDLAMAALLRAVAAQPRDCELWRLALVAGQDLLDRAGLRALLGHGPGCPEVGMDLADAQALTGRLRAARRTLRRVARQPSAASEARRRATRLDDTLQILALDPAEPASPVLARVSGVDPAAARWRRAQQALSTGERGLATALLGQALVGPGRSMEARRLAWTLGAPPPWRGLTVRGRDLVAASRGLSGEGAALTWLLDQEIVVLLPGGGALRRVHQAVRVHTSRAAEAVGELRVPPEAELLFARTWTPGGEAVLPAETPDKETVSLRRVGPGAVVEYAQLQFVGPDDPVTGATRLPPFTFQAADGPVLRGEYVLLAPPGLHPQIAASPTAPRPTPGRQGGMRRWVFRQGPVGRRRPEPHANRPAWSSPTVRVSQGATRRGVMEVYEEVLAAHDLARDPALWPWVRWAREAGRDPERWRRLVARVAAQVEQKRAGLMPGDPGVAVRDGRGDRAGLLAFLARRVGVPVCLVRLVPLSREPPLGAPDPADYRLDALTLSLRRPGGGSRTYWVDPAVEGGLLDFLRPGLRGRPGLRLGCDERGPVRAPELGAERDRRDVRVSLDWFGDGRVEATATDTLRGALAAVVRSHLRGGGDEARSEVVAFLASRAFGGMTLRWQGVSGLGDDRVPLVLRYTASAPAGASRRAALDLGLYPAALGRTYARLARRHTVLRIGQASDLDVDLVIRHHGGRPLASRPAPVDLSHRLLSLRQRVEVRAGLLRVRHRLRVRMGLVPPAEYPALAAQLRRLDQVEVLRLRRGPGVDLR